MMLPSKELRALCARKVELWAKERGTLSDENRSITTELLAQKGWDTLGEENFIKRVYAYAAGKH